MSETGLEVCAALNGCSVEKTKDGYIVHPKPFRRGAIVSWYDREPLILGDIAPLKYEAVCAQIEALTA